MTMMMKMTHTYIHIQVAQLWQTGNECSAILRGWVTLRLNFRLKCYILCQSMDH